MDDASLRKLQMLEFKILLEFKRICEKHNLRYFLIGGTLLGAVRHQGFIPWDDDIDVGMPREDYEKFKEIVQAELGEEYFYQTYETDAGYGPIFAKIRLNGTRYSEFSSVSILEHEGFWIDIMPLDKLPPTKILQKLHASLLYHLRDIIFYTYNYNISPYSTKGRIYYFIIKLESHLISREILLKIRETIYQHWNGKDTLYMLGNLELRIPLPVDIFSDTTTLSFEGVDFDVPAKYDEYLSMMYGNYLELPPESARVVHSPYQPDFGDYE